MLFDAQTANHATYDVGEDTTDLDVQTTATRVTDVTGVSMGNIAIGVPRDGGLHGSG